MTLPRPLLIALLGVALIGAALLGMRNVRTADEEEAAPAPAAAAERPAESAAPSAPAKLTSARLDVRVAGRDLAGGERFDVRLRGRFQGQGPAAVPRFELELSGTAAGERASVAAISTGDAGYVRLGGADYRLPPEAWSDVTAVRTRLAELAGAAPPAQGDAQAPLDPSAWLRSARTAPGPRIDGTATTRTTGAVDVGRVVRDLSRLSGAAGDDAAIPAGLDRQLARAVRRASVTYWVGASDRILRRARVDLAVRVPAALRDDAGGLAGGRFSVAIDLAQVNRPQEIAAPAAARDLGPGARLDELPIATALLTVGATTIDAPPGSDRVDPAALAQPAPGAAPAADVRPGEGLPAPVARGLARRHVVVLAFLGQGGDDRATRAALRGVRGRRGVTVVTDDIGNVSRYRRVVAGLGVNQAPAIVIVRRDGQAELLEGYVDRGTLVQEVADAREVEAAR